MSRPLHVLIIEDSEDDALLLARELRRADYEATFERVDTPQAMARALATQTWDLVVSDYTMPRFSGTAALELLRTSGLDIPFIFVSGTIGEETAVNAMKAGAHDFMMKGNLRRLIPAVERELRDAETRRERKRAEEEVRRNLERIRALHELDLAITSTLDLHAILDILLEKIGLFFPAAAASTIRLANRESGELEPVACRNLDEKEWKAATAKVGGGLARMLPENNAPLFVRNAQTDPRSLASDFLRKHGLVSYLRVPLIAKGEVLGVLTSFTKEEHEFTHEEVEFLATLAGQAAVAIHNSQLYEESKSQAAELEKANLELKKANRVKDEFLSVMSHELRTPLNVVMGYTGMIRDKMLGEINPDQEKALEKVLLRSTDLLSMINSILYVTSLEAKAVKVESHEMSLRDFFLELRSAYDFPLDKELTLIWDYPSELPSIKTDSAKLKHILQNLINNAIKFTKMGSVTVSAKITEELPTAIRLLPTGEARWVEFKVADTGVGIPKQHLPFIFEKFRQVDSSETRSYGGVGLGLYIAKEFTEMLGGRVEVESEPGKGATFTVRIPLEM